MRWELSGLRLWLKQNFFFWLFILEWFHIFRKIMKILKNVHILITQTPLYNILHNCKFYAVLSKLIKLALLLFYSLQTFSEFHHFSMSVFMSQDEILDLIIMSPCLFLSGTIFEQAFTSCPNNWMVGISSMFYTEMNIVSFIYQFNEHLWSVGHNTLFLALEYKHDEIILILISLFTFIHWRRKWQPTQVFLPGESQGQRSLVGCRLWGHTESDMTEAT